MKGIVIGTIVLFLLLVVLALPTHSENAAYGQTRHFNPAVERAICDVVRALSTQEREAAIRTYNVTAAERRIIRRVCSVK